ncbi:MAG: DUF4010 domain-containing protein [Bacteriovoracaceae bacterium]|nr:DUF4010 domain-containing protein [Bacteriovoracaceae bacterium]
MSLIESVHPFHQLIISIILGLFVGLQRQWADSPTGGVRTFSLISLLGTLSAFLSQKYGPLSFVIGAMGVITCIAIGNFSRISELQRQTKLGLSTEVSMLVMFVIGILIVEFPIWIAVSSAGALAVILQSKMELHEFATRFTAKELKSIMQFVLLSLIIFPIVPNKTIDTLNVINPHDVWLMVIIIVGVGLAGYIIYKFFGRSAGTLLSGILGGVISSTASTVNYSKRFMLNPALEKSSATIIMIAWTVVYLRLGLEVILVSSRFTSVFLPLFIFFTISSLCSLYFWVNGNNEKSEMPSQDNPSEIKVALIFGVLFSVIIFVVAYVNEHWGKQALFLVAFLSGITDMDAITLSTAKLVETQKIEPVIGTKILIIAASSNTIFKAAMAWLFGGKNLFLKLLVPLLLTIVSGASLIFFL